ncbi:hypothetical protein Syun_020445 [Stephania yunnanensis]|uniref:Uncharacterized protein n=1 Tax=Stephania yunnanensis TaxID=152371 RepID=A0AAP0NNW4_9MAGN
MFTPRSSRRPHHHHDDHVVLARDLLVVKSSEDEKTFGIGVGGGACRWRVLDLATMAAAAAVQVEAFAKVEGLVVVGSVVGKVEGSVVVLMVGKVEDLSAAHDAPFRTYKIFRYLLQNELAS